MGFSKWSPRPTPPFGEFNAIHLPYIGSVLYRRYGLVRLTRTTRGSIESGVNYVRIGQARDEYLDHLATTSTLALKTKRIYGEDAVDATNFMEEIGLVQIAEIDERALSKYLKRFKGMSAHTAERRFRILSRMLDFLVEKRALDVNPVRDFSKKPSGSNAVRKAGGVATREMITAIRGRDPESLRDRAIMELMLGTDSSAGAVSGLRECDVDLDAGTARIGVEVLKMGTRAVTAIVEYRDAIGAKTIGDSRDSLWISLGRRSYGNPLKPRSIYDILRRRSEMD